MGVIVAIYRNVDADKKHQYKWYDDLRQPCKHFDRVTEPTEYMLCLSQHLFTRYALVQGAAFAMADIVHLRMHSFGSIEFLTRTPLAINAGLGMDIINFYLGNCPLCSHHVLHCQLLDSKFNYATQD